MTTYTVEGDLDDVYGFVEARGWADGLPVVPPTAERVATMLGSFSPGGSAGVVPPGYREATNEVLAANAVMAGCAPPMFPVVRAAVEAMLQPRFNLAGVQATTHPVSPFLVVHGPVADRVGVGSGPGALGPGVGASSSIGRALRLILMNVGAARPGSGDQATHGSPAKFAYCMAENVEASPWPEFHTTKGFAPGDDAVTVLAGEAPHNVHDHQSSTGVRFANIVADVMRAQGHVSWIMSRGNDFGVVLGPEHAGMLARDGWSRHDVQMYLYHRSCRPVRDVMWGGNWTGRDWPAWMEGLADDPESLVPPVRHPDEVCVFVTGGPGKHSFLVPAFGNSSAVTWPVADRD
ncbi:MAG TPA: hypothetical protein VK611_22955 [Acidimicrobiales bacterium]|nr:hypothetical protein [Acidimicrobiales bacterium]